MSSGVAGLRNRWERSQPPASAASGGGDEFVVHRGKSVPTLHNVADAGTTPRLRATKEKFNTDTKAEERGESSPGGGSASGSTVFF